MNAHSVKSVLCDVAREFPRDMVAQQLASVDRIAFHIELVLEAAKSTIAGQTSVCDLGGGLGLFSVGCAAYGMKRSVLVDDFADPVNAQAGPPVLDLHRRHGVEIHAVDLVNAGLEGVDGPFDVITTFDSMEHWHSSPKMLFQQVRSLLRPGGAFVLGVPNCVNMRKRITVPFGLGKWSSMEHWYEARTFRGHVREPDLDDLRYIARDMNLSDVKVYGRNWQGLGSQNRIVRTAARLADHPLRLRPSLCSDIYMVGRAGSHH